jgi:hypothetical protein
MPRGLQNVCLHYVARGLTMTSVSESQSNNSVVYAGSNPSLAGTVSQSTLLGITNPSIVFSPSSPSNGRHASRGYVGSRLLELLTRLGEPNTTSGAHRIFIEQLYAVELADIEPYVLQLMHVAVTHRCDRTEECLLALRGFLAHVAALSLHVGMRMAWNIDSVAPVLEKVGITAPLEGLRDLVESAAVNRASLFRVYTSNADDARLTENDPTNSQLIIAARKAERVAIFNDERLVIQDLITISDRLRNNPDREARKQQLRTELTALNQNLLRRRVFLPIASSSSRPRWIVRFCPPEAIVFSSRERAPFLLVVEVVEDRDAQCTCAHPAAGRGDEHPTGLQPPESGYEDSTFAPPAAHPSSTSDPNDTLTAVFGETFAQKGERLRAYSPFGNVPGWGIAAIVVKAGDDLRQEELALQLIDRFNTIWRDAGLTVSVFPFNATATTSNGGILEFVTDALSVDSLKKRAKVQSLNHFFTQAYGGEGTQAHRAAQRNFAESMAGYSVISYLLNIKDRHNGNLMLSRDGRLIHIDFGFMFATSPGGINFESAPFKLSQELMDVMGGVNDPIFQYFKVLLFQAFVHARRRSEEIISAVQLMLPFSTLPAFGNDGNAVLAQLRQKFAPQLQSDVEVAQITWRMVEDSVDNWRTRKYDQFQTWQNGII